MSSGQGQNDDKGHDQDQTRDNEQGQTRDNDDHDAEKGHKEKQGHDNEEQGHDEGHEQSNGTRRRKSHDDEQSDEGEYHEHSRGRGRKNSHDESQGQQSKSRGRKKSHDDEHGREQSKGRGRKKSHERGKGRKEVKGEGRRKGHEEVKGEGRRKDHEEVKSPRRQKGHEKENERKHGKGDDHEGRGSRKGHGKKHDKKPRGKKAPHSREKEHKIIVSTANEIGVDIQKFVKKFVSGNKSELDYQQAIETLQHIYEMWKLETVDEVASWKDFIEVQDTKKIDKETKDTEGHAILETICQRAKYFENLIPNVRKKMIACLQDHLYKYCQSFAEVAEGYDVGPVTDFENTIQEHKTLIDSKLESINTNIIKYGECKKPFAAFVREGATHGELMEEISLYLVEICHVMKTWVRQDMDYPEKLHEEIQFNGSYNEKLEDDAKKLRSDRDELVAMLERRERQQYRLEHDFDVSRREKRKLKKSRDTVEVLLDKVEKKISDKEYEIEVLKDESKGSSTPRNKKLAGDDMEKSKKDLNRLEERRTSLKRQLERLDREYKDAADKHDDAKNNLEANEASQEDLNENITDIDLEAKNMNERTEAISKKIAVIRQMREMKLSPETLKKIHDKRQEKEKEKEKPPKKAEPLEDACKYVSEKIGNDWKKLYAILPFDPTRDEIKLYKDIMTTACIAARNDWTDDKQALHSLSKWRNFNRRGDVNQLTRSLKSVRMKDLAQKVERKFVAKSTET